MTPWFRGPMRNARMSQRCVFVAASVLLLVMIGASDVQAQALDIRRLFDRIESLERDIDTLNLQIARGAPAPAGTAPATGAPGVEGDG